MIIDQDAILQISPPGKTGWPWTEASTPLPSARIDDSPWPKISIVTPSFNQVQYIEETIRSILLQGYPNLEYIVIDGGSTDGSIEIIKKYNQWITYWVSEHDNGQSNAINKGFYHSSGKIINWLNSDDYLLPGALAQIGSHARHARTNNFIIAAPAIVVNQYGSFLRTRNITPTTGYLRTLGPIHEGGVQASWYFSKDLYLAAGRLNENLHYSMDIDLSLKMSRLNPEIILIGEPIAAFRDYEECKTRKFVSRSIKERRMMYISYINTLDIPHHSKKELIESTNKVISGMILSSVSNPTIYDFIEIAILCPHRIITRDYWRKFFLTIRQNSRTV